MATVSTTCDVSWKGTATSDHAFGGTYSFASMTKKIHSEYVADTNGETIALSHFSAIECLMVANTGSVNLTVSCNDGSNTVSQVLNSGSPPLILHSVATGTALTLASASGTCACEVLVYGT